MLYEMLYLQPRVFYRAIAILTRFIIHIFVCVFHILKLRHVEVYWIRHSEPSLVRIRFGGERLEECGHRLAEVLHVRFSAQRVIGDVWLRT